jgi:hypothetical protein
MPVFRPVVDEWSTSERRALGDVRAAVPQLGSTSTFVERWTEHNAIVTRSHALKRSV